MKSDTDEIWLEVYLKHKRDANIKMGMSERESEINILHFLDWRERGEDWVDMDPVPENVPCAYCKRSASKLTDDDIPICKPCFMGRTRCAEPGCPTIVTGHFSRCSEHTEVSTKKEE